MEFMNRSRYSEVDSHKNSKKRRTGIAKNSQSNSDLALKKINKKERATIDANAVFNDFLMLNSSPSGTDDGQKPIRSHANARERDRTHRCVITCMNW